MSAQTVTLTMRPEGLTLEKPMKLYHATVNSSAVLNSGGLRSRQDLGGLQMTGGGPDASISMTGDKRVAEAIVVALVTTCKIAQGEISGRDILNALRIIAPRVYSDFMRDRGDTGYGDVVGYDLFNLYRDILYFGYLRGRAIYDPLLVSTDLSFFDAPSSDLADNICVLSCDLSRSAHIVPRYPTFNTTATQLPGEIGNIRFPIDEFAIQRGYPSSSAILSDFRTHDGYIEYLHRSPRGDFIAVEVEFEPLQKPIRTNVSYIDNMDEYRIWDASLLSNYIELECGPSILEDILERTGQDIFYPYFEEDTLLDDLLSSQYR